MAAGVKTGAISRRWLRQAAPVGAEQAVEEQRQQAVQEDRAWT